MTADPLLVETAEQLFGDVATHDEVERSEVSGWSGAAWSALSESGFAWVGIDEERGGSGGTLFDLAALLTAAGRHAFPAPLAETAAVGGWLLAEAGVGLPAGPVTAVDGFAEIRGGRLMVDGVAMWGRFAERLVVACDDHVFALRPDQVEVTAGANLAGEPRDRVVVSADVADVLRAPLGGVDAVALMRARGALSRAVMAAGALGAVCQMTVDYTHARHQFGKPIATFQAVQAHLVTVAQAAVTATMASDVAVAAAARDAYAGRFEIAAARVVVDRAVTDGTRAAHQAHGAMGVTREYPLHQLTRRLWAWRHEWGSTSHWRRTAGEHAIGVGADGLFDIITG